MSAELKSRIAAGETVIAVNLGGRNPDVVETIARAGADLAFIDCERTGIGLDAATELIRACRAARLPCVVRSWSREHEVLVQYLDRKAEGIVVPHVDSAQEAEALVELMRYACGDNASQRMLIAQIESRAGVQDVDALARVQGVDVFLIGPNDLSYALTGTRGNIDAQVHAEIDRVCARLLAAGRRFGMPCSLEETPRFRKRGATFAYYPVEWLLESALSEATRVLKA